MSAASFYAKLKAEAEAKAAAAASGSSDAPASSSVPVAAGPPPCVVEPPSVTPPKKPVLLVFGATDWDQAGKKVGAQSDAAPNLMGPHRLLAGFGSVKLSFIASGCTSAHCIAVAQDGAAFSWGRNDCGQLGLGDTVTRSGPTPVPALDKLPVTTAATGKAHTLFLLQDGQVFACGASKQGCVGRTFNKKAEFEAAPVKVDLPGPAGGVACGANFNLVRGAESGLWAFGWSEFGVLGNGSDGEFNKSDSSVKLSYEARTTPTAIEAFVDKRVVHVACGAAHCVAVEGDGTTYTWGYGGYGRLGHRDQKDVWKPKPLEQVRAKEVSCGGAYTAIVGYPVLRGGVVPTSNPALWMWGRVKAASQDPWMYPRQEEDLRGWNVHSLACGASHTVVAADDSVISWGPQCQNGELGFGEGDKKSSAAPKKVDSLEGLRVSQVVCGVASTFVLAEADPAIVDKLPEWTPAAPSAAPAGGKRKAEPKPAGKAAGKKAKK